MTLQLARNCPLLKQIRGSKYTVRYKRSSETNSFVKVFDCAAADSSEDSDDIYEANDFDFEREVYFSDEDDK
jgi:hypothetical protein